MIDIKLVATDLDGTLLDGRKVVPDEEKKALRKCREMGVEVCLASGRSFEAVGRFARDIGMEDCLIISCNGARMDKTCDGPILFENNLDPDAAREAAVRLIRAGLYIECYCDRYIYMANRRPLPTRNHAPGLTPDGRVEFIDGAGALIERGPRMARKMIVFTDDPAEIEKARALLEGLGLSLSQSGEDNLEIMARGAGKGDMLRRYMALRGIGRENVMAFGDQTNDLDMLLSAAWSAAMGNAVREVKDACRLVVPDNDHHGVAVTLNEYALGGEDR